MTARLATLLSMLLGPLAPPLQAASPAPLLAAPRWSVGDSWTLETRYRPLQLGARARAQQAAQGEGGGDAAGGAHAHGTDEASSPSERLRKLLGKDDPLKTYWTYKVVGAEQVSPLEQAAVVQAKDRAGAKEALASLWFSRYRVGEEAGDGGEWFALTRAKFMTVQAGQPLVDRRRFQPTTGPARPVLPQDSVVPHAFPALPVLAASGEAVVHDDTRVTGGMAFAFDSEQTVTTGVLAADLQGVEGLAERLAKADLPTRDLTLVEVFRPFDGARFRQLWAPGYPWAIWGQGPWSSYHLVYAFTQNRGGGS